MARLYRATRDTHGNWSYSEIRAARSTTHGRRRRRRRGGSGGESGGVGDGGVVVVMLVASGRARAIVTQYNIVVISRIRFTHRQRYSAAR